jgi:hypothetical protein
MQVVKSRVAFQRRKDVAENLLQLYQNPKKFKSKKN